jgi:23S rRNA (adenine2503-C2)-methyltransferase
VSGARISIHDRGGLEAWRRAARVDPNLLRDFLNDLLKRSRPREEADARLSDAGVSAADLARLATRSLTLLERHASALDGATKLLFATSLGERIESVILRYATGRTSLCISSQVGCAAACGFCATGRMGLTRSLEAHEILDQVVQSNELLARDGARVRNVVFMGMGEPFHNEAAVTTAVEALTDPRRFDYSPQRVLVSTVGVPDAMVRFAERFPRANLALSLHSAIQERREALIPLAKKASVEELRNTLRRVNAVQRRPVMIEYVLLEGWNDGDHDRLALESWLDGLDVHVNLIPYNPIDGAQLRGTEKASRESFGAALKARGFKVTLRYSLGRDIAAACGQLVREESRRGSRLADRGSKRDP